jgi:hypothetical protein
MFFKLSYLLYLWAAPKENFFKFIFPPFANKQRPGGRYSRYCFYTCSNLGQLSVYNLNFFIVYLRKLYQKLFALLILSGTF